MLCVTLQLPCATCLRVLLPECCLQQYVMYMTVCDIEANPKQDRLRLDMARVSSSATAGQLPPPSARLGRMESLLAGVAQGDAALLLGGDLTVLVLEVGSLPTRLPFPEASMRNALELTRCCC
jgi:hypothetical protein